MTAFLRIYWQKTWGLLKQNKKKLAVFILLCISWFIILFPYQEAVEYLSRKIRTETRSSFQFSYDRFYFNPLSMSLVFKNPKIRIHPDQQDLALQTLKVSPSYKALLGFRLGVWLSLEWKDSKIQFTVQKKNIEKKQPGLRLSIKTYQWSPSSLSAVWPLLSKVSGRINFQADLQWDPSFKHRPKGSWALQAYNIQSQALSYVFPGRTTGAVSLPEFQWKQASSKGRIKRGEFLISHLFIGGAKDPFQMKARGLMVLDFYKRGFSRFPKMNINNYDIGLEIISSEHLKQRLYFLDLLLAGVSSKTNKGWRYMARIKGNRANFFDLSPLSQFPSSLEELQETQKP